MDELKLGRRLFLKSSGAAAAVAGGAGLAVTGQAQAATPSKAGLTALDYPTQAIGKAAAMPLNQPVAFNYPDEGSMCYAIRMGSPVAGGVGPNHDIVAYSAMCTHMGCPVQYDGGTRTFKCGCHFSMFDAEMHGQMVCGQATENLPAIKLSYDAKTDAVQAVGVAGLLYGRQSNVL